MSENANTTTNKPVLLSDDELREAFLTAIDAAPQREPGWFDLQEATEMMGCSESAAYARLKKAVADGRMEQKLVHDGKVKNVWRPKLNPLSD